MVPVGTVSVGTVLVGIGAGRDGRSGTPVDAAPMGSTAVPLGAGDVVGTVVGASTPLGADVGVVDPSGAGQSAKFSTGRSSTTPDTSTALSASSWSLHAGQVDDDGLTLHPHVRLGDSLAFEFVTDEIADDDRDRTRPPARRGRG